MSKVNYSFSLLILGLFVSIGCASIVSKSTYPVAISSTPVHAKFVVQNAEGKEIHSGMTPAIVNLEASDGYFSGADYTVVCTKEGCDKQTST